MIQISNLFRIFTLLILSIFNAVLSTGIVIANTTDGLSISGSGPDSLLESIASKLIYPNYDLVVGDFYIKNKTKSGLEINSITFTLNGDVNYPEINQFRLGKRESSNAESSTWRVIGSNPDVNDNKISFKNLDIVIPANQDILMQMEVYVSSGIKSGNFWIGINSITDIVLKNVSSFEVLNQQEFPVGLGVFTVKVGKEISELERDFANMGSGGMAMYETSYATNWNNIPGCKIEISRGDNAFNYFLRLQNTSAITSKYCYISKYQIKSSLKVNTAIEKTSNTELKITKPINEEISFSVEYANNLINDTYTIKPELLPGLTIKNLDVNFKVPDLIINFDIFNDGEKTIKGNFIYSFFIDGDLFVHQTYYHDVGIEPNAYQHREARYMPNPANLNAGKHILKVSLDQLDETLESSLSLREFGYKNNMIFEVNEDNNIAEAVFIASDVAGYNRVSQNQEPYIYNSLQHEDEVKTNENYFFPDLDKSSKESMAAVQLRRQGILNGFPDGEFKSDRLVNRAEAAKFLMWARSPMIQNISNVNFPDVISGAWYTPFVLQAEKFQIINGHPDGSFRPADSVNTAEFLKMLTKTFYLSENLPFKYKDVSPENWFASFAGVAEYYNLFPDRDKNYLDPSRQLTRGEVAVAINQILNPIQVDDPMTQAEYAKALTLKKGYSLGQSGAVQLKDVPASHPYYAYIHAANGDYVNEQMLEYFFPWRYVSRVELAQDIARMFGGVSQGDYFSDTNDSYVNQLASYGIFDEQKGENFYPYAPATLNDFEAWYERAGLKIK